MITTSPLCSSNAAGGSSRVDPPTRKTAGKPRLRTPFNGRRCRVRGAVSTGAAYPRAVPGPTDLSDRSGASRSSSEWSVCAASVSPGR